MIDDLIVRRFGEAADTYDREAGIQRTVARELLKLCPTAVDQVLELGCGTGGYTQLLCESLPGARITALDAAESMVRSARNAVPCDRVRFIAANLRTFHSDHMYDMVTSNAVLHWCHDLENVLAALANRIIPGGSLTFSHFGPGTYRELRTALTGTVGRDVAIASSGFATAVEVSAMLSRIFPSCRVDFVEYSDEFPSLHALLTNIRATGTQGGGAVPRLAWTPGLLRRVSERYVDEFGAIRVTYDVALCRADSDG